ncbi:MAG: ATP-binding protein [Patescibacteria group bacterium]|jgi:signal transduction histidine kinase
MLQILLLTIVSAVNIYLAFLVCLKGKDKVINYYFGVLVTFMVLWMVTNYLCDNPIMPAWALFWNRLTFAVASGLIMSFFLFSWNFPRNIFDFGRHVTTIGVILTLVVATLSVSTNTIIKSVDYYSWGTNAVPGTLYPLFLILFAVFVGLGFYSQIVKFIRSRGKSRSQLAFLFLGLLLSAVGVSVFGIIIPIITGLTNYGKTGVYSLVIFTALTSYAIIEHHLFDIRFIIKRTIVYSVLLSFVLMTYALVVFFSSQIIGGDLSFGIKSFAPNIIAALLIAVGFDPLKQWLSKVTDKYLFKGEYDTQEVAKKLAKQLSNVVSLDEALDTTMSIVADEMRISRVATIILRRIEKDTVVKRVKSTGYSNVVKLEDKPIGFLVDYLTKHPVMVVVEDLRDDLSKTAINRTVINGVISQIDQFQAVVALPIQVSGAVIGIMLVGEKLSGDSFDEEDFDTLELVANQTALSIEKAQFYEEDKLKSEFISIASHELLTPTAAIEGYLSMLLDEKAVPTKEQAHLYATQAYQSSRRLADLVKDLLSISRIESGRLKITAVPMDLVPSIEQATSELANIAKEKGLKLTFVKPGAGLPKVVADPDRVLQICVNLISNAIKYSMKGEIKVSAVPKKDHVLVSVQDNGIGISKTDQQHLFEKFHRIDNAKTSGIMGTGLGLYITKNLVTLLGGEMKVVSEPDKGSVFSFTLPMSK